MNITSKNHTIESGLVLQAHPDTALSDVDPGYILEMLADKGYVLFRGFSHNIEKFTDLVKSLSSSLSLDPARSFDGEDGQQEKAVAYLYKELAQLAEIEMHVASVMSRVLCELQQESTGLITNTGLFHSVSCFASEEVQHSNSFYQYVRHLSGRDIKLRQNYAKERLELYEGNENPLVKLAALCSTAYVGESIITVFERRMKVLDPMQKMFLTQLLHFHGLDEARHIEFDHFVFEHVIPSLTSSERKRMHAMINCQEELNTQLALTTQDVIKAEFDLDYTENNLAAKKQLDMTLRFREIIQSGEYIQNIDEHIDDNTAEIVKGFSKSKKIHVFG